MSETGKAEEEATSERYWFYEATDGLEPNNPHWAVAESLAGVSLMVEVLHRKMVEVQQRRDLGDPDVTFVDSLIVKASAIAMVMMLGQIDEHLIHLKGSPVWKGRLAALGTQFRSSYGQISTARDLVVHLAAHTVEDPRARHVDAKSHESQWHPGPHLLWNHRRHSLTGLIIFGRTYDLQRVLDDARALAPDVP